MKYDVWHVTLNFAVIYAVILIPLLSSRVVAENNRTCDYLWGSFQMPTRLKCHVISNTARHFPENGDTTRTVPAYGRLDPSVTASACLPSARGHNFRLLASL